MGLVDFIGKVAGNKEAQHLISRFVPIEKYSHYQRDYNWELMIPHVIGGVPGFVVCKYCQDIKFGEYDISELVRMRAGAREVFFPGLLTVNIVTATFVIPAPNLVGRFFREWKQKMVDKEGFYYPKNNYKKSIYVFMYDSTGVRTARIKMKGVFPKTFPVYPLSYGGNTVVRVDVGFSVDGFEFKGLGLDIAGVAAQVGIHL